MDVGVDWEGYWVWAQNTAWSWFLANATGMPYSTRSDDANTSPSNKAGWRYQPKPTGARMITEHPPEVLIWGPLQSTLPVDIQFSGNHLDGATVTLDGLELPVIENDYQTVRVNVPAGVRSGEFTIRTQFGSYRTSKFTVLEPDPRDAEIQEAIAAVETALAYLKSRLSTGERRG